MRGKDLALAVGLAGVGAWLATRAYRQATRYNFSGKTVLITGGSRGLGLVMARQLARRRAKVVICARDRDELLRAHDQLLAEGGGPVLSIRCDVTDPEQVEETVAMTRSRFGPVDVLINNAGVIAVGPLETMTVDDFREAMAVNYWAPVYTTLAVLPEMRERGGRIVNVSSIGGKVSVPHLLPYSASKFALTGFSEGLRAELAGDGVVVTTVCPGLMRTGSPRNASFKGRHREEYAWFSIGDALPVTSMSAESAARRILDACARGDAEVVLSLAAKFAVLVHDLFPGLTQEVLALVNRLLPAPGGIGSESRPGRDSESDWSPSWLTALGNRAARRNNQIAPGEDPGG